MAKPWKRREGWLQYLDLGNTECVGLCLCTQRHAQVATEAYCCYCCCCCWWWWWWYTITLASVCCYICDSVRLQSLHCVVRIQINFKICIWAAISHHYHRHHPCVNSRMAWPWADIAGLVNIPAENSIELVIVKPTQHVTSLTIN